MPTEDAHSSGHMVPSYVGLAYVQLVETNPYPKFVVFLPDYALRAFSIFILNSFLVRPFDYTALAVNYYQFWPYYQISGGFHGTLRRMQLANRGRLLLRTPGPVTFNLGLAFVLMLRPFFPELVMSTDFLSFEHPSVLLFCLEHWDPVNRFYLTGWVAIATPTDRLESVLNRCVIKHFGVFVFSLSFFLTFLLV